MLSSIETAGSFKDFEGFCQVVRDQLILILKGLLMLGRGAEPPYQVDMQAHLCW